MPAYNAALTLQSTYHEIPFDIVDDVILIDDCSHDNTVAVANSIGIKHIIRHDTNLGYGGNQKSCYKKALELGADVVIMLHPDYQYTPKLIRGMASLITEIVFQCVLGSRILGTGAIRGGMPYHKYVSNRFLTAFQNILLGYKLSEYHNGYRAFSKSILQDLPLEQNANGFLFDNQMLLQIIYAGYHIGEITCPNRYDTESSSINLINSIKYGLGVIGTTIRYVIHKMGIIKCPLFSPLDKKNKNDVN